MVPEIDLPHQDSPWNWKSINVIPEIYHQTSMSSLPFNSVNFFVSVLTWHMCKATIQWYDATWI